MYFRDRTRVPARVLAHGAAALVLALIAGCAAFRVPEEPLTPEPLRPVWDLKMIREHLEYLNDTSLSGRATGTQGYARAAAYVSARLREFEIQPAIGNDFRVIYSAALNVPVSASLRAVSGADSVIFLPGIDFLPDARSGSGLEQVSHFMIVGNDTDPSAAPRGRRFGIIVPPGETADLAAWRDTGARTAILVGELRPRLRSSPIDGLMVVQATPEATAQLLQITAEPSSYLHDQIGHTLALGRAISTRVVTRYQPQAGAINILGYIAGKHPDRRRELVIFCSDMDALGQFGGITALDFRNFGIATASLLDVARNLGYITRRWSVPERSILIAVWSGSLVGHNGLRHFLEHPTWSLDRVASVVYLGLRPDLEAEVHELLDPLGIPLISIPPPPEPLFSRDVVLTPEPAVQALARARAPENAEHVEPDMSQIVDSAVVRAVDLATIGYNRAMLSAIAPAPFHPVREDSLRVPSAAGTD